MAQFTLGWDITPLSGNSNVIGQEARYRQKDIGGSWITTGFSPGNPLSVATSSTTSPNLAANVLWEFQVRTLCTVGGPTLNTNGTIEGLKFACITGSISHTSSSVTIVLDVTGTNITKARFTLKQTSDGGITFAPTVFDRSGDSITNNITGLPEGVSYYWEIELIATINGVEVYSSAPTGSGGLGSPCISANVVTDTSTCDGVNSLTVTPV